MSLNLASHVKHMQLIITTDDNSIINEILIQMHLICVQNYLTLEKEVLLYALNNINF